MKFEGVLGISAKKKVEAAVVGQAVGWRVVRFGVCDFRRIDFP